MNTSEKEFLERIETHRGILFKIAKMYMDNYDEADSTTKCNF